MIRTAVARALSIAGHPAILMPFAVTVAAVTRGASPAVLYVAAGATIAVAVAIAAFSIVQVRSGRWTHVDASVPSERSQLNVVSAGLLLGAAALLWVNGQPLALVAGSAIAGALVVLAHLLKAAFKLSLHCAFAVYAASLLWPSVALVAVTLVLSAAVAWSRLVLRRHTPPEVVSGLLSGAVAGVGFNIIAG